MYLSKRQLKLFELLKKENDFQPMSYYSHMLNVSSRTISSDIDKINNEIESFLGVVVRKSGVGVKFVQNKDFNNTPTDTKPIFLKDDRYNRVIAIIQKLLFNNKTITYDYLIEKFYISKTSITKDLDYIETILTNGNFLKLVRDNNGTRLEGTEKDFRKAHIEFNNWTKKELVSQKGDYQTITKLLERFYGTEIVNKSYEVLYTTMKMDRESIADYYVLNVLNALIVIVYRISKCKHPSEKNIDKEDYHLNLAEEILDNICHSFNMSYTKSDVLNLSEYLISNRFQLVSVDYGSEILPKLLKNLTNQFNLNFNISNITYQQLSNHISTMIYRLKNGIRITNPFINEIRNEYSELLNILWVILDEFEDKLDITFTEDEIGFLVIYLQSTIEYRDKGRNFLVVCPWGLAASNLLVKQIVRICNKEDKILTTSIKAVNEGEIPSNIDLIISTVELEIPETEYIKVPSILGINKLEEIKEVIKRKEYSTNKLESFQNISKLIDETSFLTEANFKSKEGIIKYVSKTLIKTGKAKEKIENSFFEREKIGGTDLEVGVALPHASPEFVKKSTLFIINNKEMIDWGTYKVKYIIFVCIEKQDLESMKDIFADIFRIIESRDSVEEFFKLLNKQKQLGGVK